MIKQSAMLCLAGLLWSTGASARVFQIGNESFATYLRGQYSKAMQNDTPFAPSGGSGVVYDSAYTTNLAYEFGFVYATSFANFIFGFEVLKPAILKNVKGSDSSGTSLYTVSNDISGYAPKLGVEINLTKGPASRIFMNAQYGSATVTVQNSYAFTTAGNTQYPTTPDFREEVKGTAPLMEYGMGFETLISDTATFVVDIGYRNLELTSFKHNADATTFQGAVKKGDSAKNTDGSARTLSLSGGFAALSIRIYIK